MPSIGVICPNERILDNVMKAAEELNLVEQVSAKVGNVWDAIGIVEEMQQHGVEVFVARGSTADFLIRSITHLTVVPITISCRDLQDLVREAQKLTGLSSPRIAVMSVRVMNEDVELYARALGVDMTLYPIIGTPESIDKALDEVELNGADVVVGGYMTTAMAKSEGFLAMHLPTGVETLKLVLAEAAKMVRAIKLEQARTKRFETMIRHIREGFLFVEATGRIRIVNPAAEFMLGRPAAELTASRIGDVLPLPGIDDCLINLAEPVEELVSAGDATLIATIIPAHVGEEPSGIIVTLQETSRISQMDTRIRRSLNVKGLAAPYRFDDLWGGSTAIREAKRLAAEYAGVDSTVLIFGETGTGKELFAQSIHNAGRCAGGPFVAVNCAALPPSLLESELFGYEEGAFTGANRRGKTGLIELAHNGTLFLDEVSEMDQYGQVRLLRFLQERQIMRLGGDKYIPVQVRVVAATNRDLAAMVAAREFREDLFYRLKVLTLNVPPLRERLGDITLITEKMRQRWEADLGHKIRFAPEVIALLRNHHWPGNVRELANVVENLAVASRLRAVTVDMAKRMLAHRPPAPASPPLDGAAPVQGKDREAKDMHPERRAIVRAMGQAEGNQTRAAALLGMHRSTLHRKMLMYGIRFEAH